MHWNHLVEYYPKERTQPPMIEKNVLMDRRHDDLHERLMKHRIQKLINSEQLGRDASLPFPNEPLHTAAITVPKNWVCNASNDSGVNSSLVLSPAMPITPNIWQPCLIASTLRMEPPTGPLTPIQQFFNFSRISKNKEPKYNRSKPVHPDPPSVLQTRTRKGYKL